MDRRVFAVVGVVVVVLAALSPAAHATSWAPGVKATLPTNAASSPGVFLASVSCRSAGNCSAVGTYIDASLHFQGLLLTESGGAWAPGVEVTLPANSGPDPDVGLASV